MSSNTLVSIGSLNIASAFRDENGSSPLHSRLRLIQELLGDFSKEKFSILCIQEVRPTGNLSAFQVIESIRSALGPTWEFFDQKINPSASAFHRTIFWDSSKWHHFRSVVQYCENKREPHFPYAFVISYFTTANSAINHAEFSVINVHAPIRAEDRIPYWNQIYSRVGGNCIALGDFNKFASEMMEYRSIFNDNVTDLVSPETETFVSFSDDLNPKGELWRSSLDGVVVDACHLRADVEVISTEELPRPTDHFLISAHVSKV